MADKKIDDTHTDTGYLKKRERIGQRGGERKGKGKDSKSVKITNTNGRYEQREIWGGCESNKGN